MPTARVSRRLDGGLEVAAHPAESQVASGCDATHVGARSSASRANAAAGSAPSGATAITPRSRSPSAVVDRGRPASATSAGSAARRGRLGVRRVEARPGPGTSSVAAALVGAAGQPRRPAWRRSTDSHDVGVRRDGGRLVALQPADEVPAQVEVGALGAPSPRPPGGGSPRRRVTPSSASSRTSEAGKNLVTTTSVTSSASRPAPRAGRGDPLAHARRGPPRSRRGAAHAVAPGAGPGRPAGRRAAPSRR